MAIIRLVSLRKSVLALTGLIVTLTFVGCVTTASAQAQSERSVSATSDGFTLPDEVRLRMQAAM